MLVGRDNQEQVLLLEDLWDLEHEGRVEREALSLLLIEKFSFFPEFWSIL